MSLVPSNGTKSSISLGNTNITVTANMSAKVTYSETYHTYDEDGRLKGTRQAKLELEHSPQKAVISKNLKAPEKTVAKGPTGSVTKVPSPTLKTPTLATKANTTISKPAPTLPVKTIGSGATVKKTTTLQRSTSIQSTSSTVTKRSVTGSK